MRRRLLLAIAAAAPALVMIFSGTFVPAHARCGDALFNVGEGCDEGDLGGFLQTFAVDAAMGPLVGLTRVPDTFPSGNTRWLVGDPTRDRVVALGADGDLLGGFASLPGAGISDVQIAPDGVVYVVSNTSARIDRFLVTTGQSLGAFPLGGGLVAPQAVASSGNFIYIASAGDAPIQRIGATTGALIGAFGEARGERDLAFDASGDLFTIRGATVHRWSATGADLGVFADASSDVGNAGQLDALAFADDGTLYVLGESGGLAVLVRYAAEGRKIGVGSPSGLTATLLFADVDTVAGDPQIKVSLRQGQVSGIGTFARGNSDVAPDACRLDCTNRRCGDRVQDSVEACDDGSVAGGDGCAACALEPGWICRGTTCAKTCGDNDLDAGEACDDGGSINGDGCSANCVVEPGWVCLGNLCSAERCGDRITAGDETCDDGNQDAGDGCDASCQSEVCTTCEAHCGDGIADVGEACDDGDKDPGDGCGARCEVEAGWVCAIGDDGFVCVAERCGDHIAAGDEACDDGNDATGDGCDGCDLEPGWVCPRGDGVCHQTCGDNIVDVGEACDDGTISGGDGCDPSCRIEPGWSCPIFGGVCAAARCGDGVVAGSEACDDGNDAGGDGCAACVVELGWVCDLDGCRETCGNGVIELGEECDLGDLVDGDGCDATCRKEVGWFCDALDCTPICGDLMLVGGERCEDQNEVAGDGCNGCLLEPGWVCALPVPPTEGEEVAPFCAATCGNLELDANEACDDGDILTGDGCDASCAVESGWQCGAFGCSEICGDRLVVGDEGCDDGNPDGFDGCDRCVREAGWVCDQNGCRETCGNGVVEAAEPCDDGDLERGDGCDDLCDVEPGWACVVDGSGVPASASVCDAAECGDGILAGFEDCDDGGTELGDGCDAFCSAEVGWTCNALGCNAICGDGRWLGAEACDDGNPIAGDGCTACGIEGEWTCTGTRGGSSTCRPSEVCGDGDQGGSEPCDDGNDETGDGCTPACEVEEGWVCGPDVLDDGPGCAQIDDDGDGLSNLEELALGTAVDDVDSDDDGLEDGDEVARGTDPNDADSDDDGLDDGVEVDLGTDPLRFDSDGDGIRDAADNCPSTPNPDQYDLDKDGRGAACEADDVPPSVIYGGGCAGGFEGPLAGVFAAFIVLALRRRSA